MLRELYSMQAAGHMITHSVLLLTLLLSLTYKFFFFLGTFEYSNDRRRESHSTFSEHIIFNELKVVGRYTNELSRVAITNGIQNCIESTSVVNSLLKSHCVLFFSAT